MEGKWAGAARTTTMGAWPNGGNSSLQERTNRRQAMICKRAHVDEAKQRSGLNLVFASDKNTTAIIY